MAVGMTILLGWIIKKLASAPVRQEFRPALAPTTIAGNQA
jgi:hypothetical protein